MPTELCFYSLATQSEMVRRGDVSARDLIHAHLKRLETHDTVLHTQLALCEQAFELADAVDSSRQRGQTLGPLAGVPLAIKDNIVSQDSPTTAGSRMLQGFRAPYEATVLTRLKSSGAIPLFKANLDAFGMGSDTAHSYAGPSFNPWSLAHVPGGSSGGSAAAVAAHFAAGALGSDTGGSIRQPASFCGVVGLKPTYGRVSRWGLIAYASSLEQIGPLARTTSDARLLFEAMAGQDPRDSTTLSQGLAPSPSRGSLRGVRLGVLQDIKGLDNEVERHLAKVYRTFEREGAVLVPISLPHVEHALSAYYLIATAEASSNLGRYDGVRFGHRAEDPKDLNDLYERSRSEGFGEEVKRRLLLGTFALSSGYYDAYYEKAAKVRTLVIQHLATVFQTCEALLSPVSPVLPWLHGQHHRDPLAAYLNDTLTVLANLSGFPALSVPCGLRSEQTPALPIGLHLMGPALSELSLLDLGHWVERLFPLPACPFGRS